MAAAMATYGGAYVKFKQPRISLIVVGRRYHGKLNKRIYLYR